ncbi:transcriptional repressor DicA [Acholeplasma oculi]|uniref:Cro/C1-type transcriptional regulator n=1 Tax=Acholeplasma oculi TaxID=35623 RepID=A0A061AAF1_9MOLU|nr:helix-turn-helix transcriptional regulator [Acholeplasma oculi]CDR30880.1 Cro/C1-type transcriptional regulator [Acholeplasma oculi]SKC35395.1 Helix-turn-helix [Acholeplasma oculi]SUT90019.1 transcriptional repressor DicA [Acholeplasma oculi]
MENNKKELVNHLAENIAYYRKKMSLTQMELATKLNYSDKSISKWERGEGVPDIFVIKELSLFFGITVDQMISKRRKHFSLFRYRYILAYFYASIVWLISGFSFGLLSVLRVEYDAWKLFVYSIPASSLILLCFFIVWRHIKYIYVYLTIFIWSLALSITLLMDDPTNYWIYIIMLPIYFFTVFMFYVIYKPKKEK